MFTIISALFSINIILGQVVTPISGWASQSLQKKQEFCYGETFTPTWRPRHYDLRFVVNPQNSTFAGLARITGVISVNETSDIILHSVNLTVHEVRFDTTDVQWNYDESAEAIVIEAPYRLVRNQPFELIIKYDGVFHEEGGLMKIDNSQTRPTIFTHLEPVSARRLFPCIDLPKFKATFKIKIKNGKEKYVVLSNMPVIDSSESNWIEFQTTPNMSTYLVAFVMCDYSPVILSADKNVTLWVPEDQVAYTKMAAHVTAPLLEALENYLQSTFTLPKVDIYTIPPLNSIGGMENWGLIMLGMDSILHDENSSKVTDDERVLSSITHEFSHNWFGNLLTVKSWCHMWFIEAIPTFLHGKIPQQVFPSSSMEMYVKRTSRFTVMDSEFVFSSKPLRVTEGNLLDESDLFSYSTYYKGAAVLSMLESVLTPPVFQKALRTLIQKYQHRLITALNFWDEVQKEVEDNNITLPTKVGNIMYNWTVLEGHPVVHIYRDLNSGKLQVMQKLCRIWKPTNGRRNLWWIPLSYTTSVKPDYRNTQPKIWLPPVQQAFELEGFLKNDQWIIFNLRDSGYYRVNYDLHTWNLLIKQLKDDHTIIDPINRGTLIDDSFKMALSSDIDFSIPLALMTYLRKERDSFPWTSVNENTRLIYGITKGKTSLMFKKFIQNLLEDVFNEVSTQQYASHEMSKRTMRQDVFSLAALVDLPQLDSYSEELALKIVRGQKQENEIPSEISVTIWCTAIKTGPTEIFEYIYDQFLKEDDRVKKENILLSQLECSSKHTGVLLKEILNWCPHDISNFVVSHWLVECEEIINKLPIDNVTAIINEELFEINDQDKENNGLCWEKAKSIWNVSTKEFNRPESFFKKQLTIQISKWLTENSSSY